MFVDFPEEAYNTENLDQVQKSLTLLEQELDSAFLGKSSNIVDGISNCIQLNNDSNYKIIMDHFTNLLKYSFLVATAEIFNNDELEIKNYVADSNNWYFPAIQICSNSKYKNLLAEYGLGFDGENTKSEDLVTQTPFFTVPSIAINIEELISQANSIEGFKTASLTIAWQLKEYIKNLHILVKESSGKSREFIEMHFNSKGFILLGNP